MRPRDVTEAEVQAKLAVLRAGQPWSALGAAATVLAVVMLLGERFLREQGLSNPVIYAGAFLFLAAGVVLQIVGRRRRKAFLGAREAR